MGTRKKAARARRGAPEFKPTDEQRKSVEAMAAFGIPHDDIAQTVTNPRTGRPVTPKTLRRSFPAELRQGKVKANAKVAQSLFTMATSGNVSAAIWWTKAQMGWSETAKHELTGADGKPIEVHQSGVLVVPSAANVEDWELASKAHREKIKEQAAKILAGIAESAKT